jgi:hypothetical protein
LLLTSSSLIVTWQRNSGDKMVRLWDLAEGKERAAFLSGADQGTEQGVHAAAFAPATSAFFDPTKTSDPPLPCSMNRLAAWRA